MSAWDWGMFCRDTATGEAIASCFGPGGKEQTYLQWMLSAWGWTLTVALLALVPPWVLIYLVAVFAAGILLSMSIFGIVLTRLLGSAWMVRTIGRSAAALTALASIGLGVYWMA